MLPHIQFLLLPHTVSDMQLFSFWSGVVYGYNVSLGSSLSYIKQDLNLNTFEIQMVSMTATWTDACTMVLAGYLSDRLGYASIGLVGMMVGVMGGILALLGNMQGLILSRLCTGMGNGVALLILPMYIAKSIHVMEYRQVCLALFQFG